VFHPLQKEQIRDIARIQTEHLRARLGEREIELEISDAALDRLAAAGFDPVYGARPLKRAVQSMVENPLAKRILQGEFPPGSRIVVEANKEGALSFNSPC
jgi:ATP-dependent Clp protease ATP-binding subunit ClpB